MIDAAITLHGSSGVRQAVLGDYLDAAADEQAHEAAYDWIKALRALPVDGVPLRDRFTVRGDSLWWFTELYLHKERVVLDVHRAIRAFDAMFDRERPERLSLVSASPVLRHVAGEICRRRGVPFGAHVPASTWLRRLGRLDLRARALTVSALATPARWRRPPRETRGVSVAAFIHRAFWRAGEDEGSAETYVGPILSELERRTAAVRYVGIGPATNFRARRRLSLTAAGPASVVPVERYAGLRALSESRGIWRRRFADFKALASGSDIRARAAIDGVDCWPIIREQLAGVAWLQWPWSVRAMDEAAAALDHLDPGAAVTYAEAGGWGRALILEARRRGIPSVGLQHGFIYRHWLNYRHEPDEMTPAGTPPFPRPTRTLLFDDYAAHHLASRGRMPSSALMVTGSPRLDELAGAYARVTPEVGGALRTELGIGPDAAVVLVTTKEKEARDSLGALLDAAASLPGVAVVIKPHPAETPDVYATYVRGRSGVIRVVPASRPLAPLLAIAGAVVTVNSTVALDAGALDIPALALGLPNNLSPFVEAGAIAGGSDPAELGALLRRILYDGGFRDQLQDRRRAVFGDAAGRHGRHAAARSAEAIVELVRTRERPADEAKS